MRAYCTHINSHTNFILESGSDNDVDETMEDADEGDNDADQDMDGNDEEGEGEGDNDDDEGEDDDEDDGDEDQDETKDAPRSRQPSKPPQPPSANGDVHSIASPGTRISFRPPVRPEALTAPVYDIVPTMAAPQGTSINTVTATPDMRWVFTGGTDGYIRKFNWPDTANGKLMLTVAQRHPFVDSVTKAGVLMSYWENEDPRVRTPIMNGLEESVPTTPVYSLAVHHQGLWLLSGGESGGINLQTVRHNEGTKIVTLSEHTSAVSVLQLSEDERSVLSGSWDKTIIDWDLNNGQVKRKFEGSAGQISAIEPRPLSSLPVPRDIGVKVSLTDTFSSNNAAKPRAGADQSNGHSADNAVDASEVQPNDEHDDAPGSPDDMNSLFGDDDDAVGGGPSMSLGDNDNEAPTMPGLDEDEDEFSRAIREHDTEQPDAPQGDVDAGQEDTTIGGAVQPPDATGEATTQPSERQEVKPEPSLTNGLHENAETMANGAPHSEDAAVTVTDGPSNEAHPTSDSTFLDAAIDGVIRVWDRRAPNPIAKIISPSPWCMNACWSPDGNRIYAGRRNGTVDEYDLHKGLREAVRTFKFPAGSGPVSAVRAMPNGRHLIW